MFRFNMGLFLFLEALDLYLTKIYLFQQFSVEELNPIAINLYNQFGFFGVTLLKYSSVFIATLAIFTIKEYEPKKAIKTLLFINFILILTTLLFMAL